MTTKKSIDDKLLALFNAIVKPADDTVTFDGVAERYAENYSVKDIFIKNVDKLVEKIPMLYDATTLLQSRTTRPVSVRWIDSWFDRMTFDESSIIHSIPENLKTVTVITHRIMLLYSINNLNVIIHGSFAAHLVDSAVKYADIDITSTRDDLVFLTSYMLYLFLGLKSHVFSIPFIINHRQLRVDGHTTSIADALKIDLMTANNTQPMVVKLNKRINFNIQNPIIQFFNYFKMFHLKERRMKMRHYKPNQKLILTTIFSEAMRNLGYNRERMNKIVPYSIDFDASIDSVIIMYMSYMNLNFKIVFHTGFTDRNFLPGLLEHLGSSRESRDVVKFNQLSSVFPEQCYEVFTSTGSELHINLSRNEVQRVVWADELVTGEESTDRMIAPVSQLNMMAIVGLHYFFTRSFNTNVVESFIRMIRTIIGYCEVMVEPPMTMLYDRTKNTGNHIIRSIFHERLFIPSIYSTNPIEYYQLEPNSKQLKKTGEGSIDDYISKYK